MDLFLAVYRKLDGLQRRRWFRVAASLVVLVLCGGLFGTRLAVSYELDGHREALSRALADQSLQRGDEHAVSLAQSGTVTVAGRSYGGAAIGRIIRAFFDADGNLIGQSQLVEALLGDVRPTGPHALGVGSPGQTQVQALTITGWLLLVVWLDLTVALLLTAAGTLVPVVFAVLLGSPAGALAFGGMGLLTFTYVLLTRLVLLGFSFGFQILAVAHTVVKEASRSRISLVFVILLLVALPLIPLTLDADEPLRYRIQTFIASSLFWTGVLAGAMTLFLSCATVAFEIRDRQIWQLMTKPLARFNYLAGKWLGVVSVNLVILLVAGVSIFTFTEYLRRLPVAAGQAGYEDRLAVEDEVLTARVGRLPVVEPLDAAQLRARVEQVIERDPALAVLDEVPRARKNQIAREIQQNHLDQQRSIPPSNGARTYVFEGLGSARDLRSTLTLRYRFHILRDDEHARFPVMFVFNEDPQSARVRQYTPTVTHREHIEPYYVRDEGTLAVTVVNLQPRDDQGRGELNFEADDFELLYAAGRFEANFFRAVLVTWTKLAFIAMLGIASATLLSFPVSVLFTFTIVIAAVMSPFLALSLQEYYPPDPTRLDWANVGQVLEYLLKTVIRSVAQAMVFMLGRFGQYRPGLSLVEGRLISWSAVASSVFWLGVIWSGIAMGFGYLVLRKRQLAIYSGHG